jgi:MFS family permease
MGAKATQNGVRREVGPDERLERAALALLLALHVLAACVFFPPREVFRADPLRFVDYPVHAHRVFAYREALAQSGLPWGYDPAVGAGFVEGPHNDLGAKPQQVLGVLLPFLPPGTVVRLFLFVGLLSIPLWSWLASRLLGLDRRERFWVTAFIVGALWSGWTLQTYLRAGLVSFVAAGALSPLILALFLLFLARPGRRSYIVLAATLALMALLHLLGPLTIALPLVLMTFLVRPLSWRWRAALIFTPLLLLVVNGFWFVPAFLGRRAPPDPQVVFAGAATARHLTYGSLGEVLERMDLLWLGSRSVLVILAVLGFLELRRRAGSRVVVGFALAVAGTLALSYLGSFWAPTRVLQSVRFIVPALFLMAIPVGLGLKDLVDRLPVRPGAMALAVVVLVAAVSAVGSRGPHPLPLPPEPDPLREFVDVRTSPGDRLLVQSSDGYQQGGYEARVLPLVYGREIVGCTFSSVENPAQFLRDVLLGRRLSDWSPEELRGALDRWGISWSFTKTEEARVLFEATTGQPGDPVGKYHAFRVTEPVSRFLIGGGQVSAGINRLRLTGLKPDDGLVVLRYRYHPAWKASPGVVLEPYPIPEDPVGFLALEDPPPDVTLDFSPRDMLFAPWPTTNGPVDGRE